MLFVVISCISKAFLLDKDLVFHEVRLLSGVKDEAEKGAS